MVTRKMELRRVGVFSAVKTSFLIGGLGGLIFGILEWALLGVIMIGLQSAPSMEGEILERAGIGGALGAGLSALGILLPLFGAIAGAVGGVIGGFLVAVLYNLSARLWGGLESEWSEMAVAAPAFVTREATSSRGATPLPEGDPSGHAPAARRNDDLPGVSRYE